MFGWAAALALLFMILYLGEAVALNTHQAVRLHGAEEIGFRDPLLPSLNKLYTDHGVFDVPWAPPVERGPVVLKQGVLTGHVYAVCNGPSGCPRPITIVGILLFVLAVPAIVVGIFDPAARPYSIVFAFLVGLWATHPVVTAILNRIPG